MISTSAPPREEEKVTHTFLATVRGGDQRSLDLVVKSCLLRAPWLIRLLFSCLPSPEYVFYTLVQRELPAPDDGKPYLAAPKAVIALDSRPHAHHFLVLERIHGRVYTDYDGATGAQAKKFLEAVASMHAHFWGQDGGGIAQEVKRINSAPVALVPKIMFLTPLRRFKHCWQTIEACLAAGMPGTICHGDCRFGNTLWPDDEQDPRVFFLDWEMHMWKDCLWDVIYFIWLSVPPQEDAAPGEGPLSAADWALVDAYRARMAELLPPGAASADAAARQAATAAATSPRSKRKRFEEILDESRRMKEAAFPSDAVFTQLLALAQLRYAFFVAVVVAVGAADEWEDNNPKDHRVWTRNIALRQDRMWERELATGEMAATLDAFAPDGRPWAATLRALHEEGERMKHREIAKRRRKGHA